MPKRFKVVELLNVVGTAPPPAALPDRGQLSVAAAPGGDDPSFSVVEEVKKSSLAP